MATIRKLEQKRRTVYRAVIRPKGQDLSRTFRRKSDAGKAQAKSKLNH